MFEITIRDLLGIVCIVFFFLFVAVLTETARKYFHIPRLFTRKFSNVLLGFSIPLCINLFSNWYFALVPFLLINLILFALMRLSDLGSLSRTEQTSIERRGLIIQAIYFQVTCVVLLAFFWGFLGVDHSYFASLGSLSWGFGDTAAGVLGRIYGKKKYRSKIFDHKKTVEGSISMFMIVFFVMFLVLESVTKTLLITLLISLPATFVGVFIEAVSRKGTDTLTVPLSISYVSYCLLILLGAK